MVSPARLFPFLRRSEQRSAQGPPPQASADERLNLAAEFRELRESLGPQYRDWRVEPLLRHMQGFAWRGNSTMGQRYAPHLSESESYGQLVRDLYSIAHASGHGLPSLTLSALMEQHPGWQEMHRYQHDVPARVLQEKEWLPSQAGTTALLRLTGLDRSHARLLVKRIFSRVGHEEAPLVRSLKEELATVLADVLHLFLPGREWHRPKQLPGELPLYELRWRPTAQETEQKEMSAAIATAKRTGIPLEFGYSSPRPSAQEPARRAIHVKRVNVLERHRTFFMGQEGERVRSFAFRRVQWAHSRPTTPHSTQADPHLYISLAKPHRITRGSLLTLSLGPRQELAALYPEVAEA